MKNVMRIAGLATTLALIAPVASKAEPGEVGLHRTGTHRQMRMRPGFDRLDIDGEGRITVAEVSDRMRARFKGADSDGDGALSRADLVGRMIARRDSDGDGQLDWREVQAMQSEGMMTRMDIDGDGAVSRDEVARRRAARHARQHGTRGRTTGE